MFPALVLVAALSCPGHSVADLKAAVAAPPADHLARLSEADQKRIVGRPPGSTILTVTGPGVGEGFVILVLVKDGCVLDMVRLPIEQYNHMMGRQGV